MIQIILLILGINYAFQRPKIKGFTTEDFPDVPAEIFTQWRALELKSMGLFLWATWGWLVIATVLGFFMPRTFPGGEMGYQILYLLVFLLLLILSAVPGSKAAKLKRRYGIKWSSSSSRQQDKFHQQALNVVTRPTKDERFKNTRFYVRASHGGDFIGPLTMEEMRNKLMTEELQLIDRAIEAVGQTSSKLSRTPAEDWVPLGEIFELVSQQNIRESSINDAQDANAIRTTLNQHTEVMHTPEHEHVLNGIFLAKPGGELKGPYLLDEIKKMVSDQVINDEELWVWYEGLDNWVPLHQLPGLDSPEYRADISPRTEMGLPGCV